MSRRLITFLSILLLAATLTSCVTIGRRHPKSTSPSAPRPVTIGTILLVNEESKFVLIDGGEYPAPAPGATLTAYTGSTESGTLASTKMSRRPHIIADIKDGAPKKGDRVMALPVLKAEKAMPALPTPETPTKKKPWWKLF